MEAGQVRATSRRSRADRRSSRLRLTLRERRRGFERRESTLGPFAYAAHTSLAALHDTPLLLATMLAVLNVFNVLDLLLTLRAVAQGVPEGNPVIGMLLRHGPEYAAVFKLGVIGTVTALLWRYRRYRVVLEAAVIILAVYALIIVHHGVGIALNG